LWISSTTTTSNLEARVSLVEKEATKDAVPSFVQHELPNGVGDDDDLVLFFAGHGTTRASKVGEIRNRVGHIARYGIGGWAPGANILLFNSQVGFRHGPLSSRKILKRREITP
jgi:hypothetical protein